MIRYTLWLIFFFIFSAFADSLDKGLEYFKSGNYEKAQQVFQQLIDENDQNHAAYFWLGRTYFMLKDFEQASDYFEEAIDLNENNADYYFWYGNSLGNEIQTVNVFKQAIMAGDILEAYENAIKADPGHIGAHVGAAQFYLQAPGIMGGTSIRQKKKQVY